MVLSLLLAMPAVEALAEPSPYRETVDGYPCGYHCHLPRPGDEIFKVSTRCLPGGCGWALPVESVQISQFVAGQGWVDLNWETFTAMPSPSGITSVYVHGNGMDPYWAERRGWEMYHEVTRNLSMDQNLRYVIWSWPTEQQGGVLRSVRHNAVRADSDAYYLASYLATLSPDEQVSISAFSLGARVVSGACHLLGGGSLNGRVLPQNERNIHGYRVVYFSAAVTWTALCPGGFHSEALNVTDRLLNIYNRADKVLRFYHLATRRRGDEAAGCLGFSLYADQREKVEQCNASGILGSEHSWDNLVCSFCLMEQARQYLQCRPLVEEAALAAHGTAVPTKALHGDS